MHVTHHHLAGSCIGLAAILALGCHDSTAPAEQPREQLAPTGAIEITVSTTSEQINLDPDGYYVGVDDRFFPPIGTNAKVTIGSLQPGKHVIWLGGLASNCRVDSANPLTADVTSDNATPVSFSVICHAKSADGAGDWDY
jgi:hypothetical protein